LSDQALRERAHAVDPGDDAFVLHVAFIDEFPLTSTGKIRKVKLREPARTARPDSQVLPGSGAELRH
jgi:acyl-CoA synthetase (AMP-forming)/AMP-acid ligase II